MILSGVRTAVLITNKSHLPVTQLRFGDTGEQKEDGYHTLGKLKCYGMNLLRDKEHALVPTFLSKTVFCN